MLEWIVPPGGGDNYWGRTDNNTYLLNQYDNIGLGTSDPQEVLHIQKVVGDDEPDKGTIIRLENYYLPNGQSFEIFDYFAWDIENNKRNLNIKFSGSQAVPNTETETKFTFNSNGKLGLGTENPIKQIHIVSETTPALRIEKRNDDIQWGTVPQIWDIELNTSNLSFNYNEENSEIEFHNNGKIEANQLSIANNMFNVVETGEVGLGTETPEVNLHLKTDAQTTIRLEGIYDAVPTKTDVPFAWDLRAQSNKLYFDNTDDGTQNKSLISFTNNGKITAKQLAVANNKFLVDENGNVTATSFNGDGLILWEQNGDNIYYNDGNVGIGTTNPNKPLTIKGTGNNSEWISLKDKNGDNQWHINYKDEGINFVEMGQADGRLYLQDGGNVGIGTPNPKALFSVNNEFVVTAEGHAFARRVKVTQGNMPDYVFEPDYDLLPLPELETYITKNRHLPDVPSEAEVKENGMDLGEFNTILLKKIEELTLYIIEQDKKITKMQKEMNKLKK